MGAETGIAWTDHTFNPWWGCARVSPGCEHCYAEAWDARWAKTETVVRAGGAIIEDVPVRHWGTQAPRRLFGDAHWNEPLKWNRDAAKTGSRARVFCASMADVFEDRRDLDEQRQRLWHLILDTPALDWQLLTKRPENIRKIYAPEFIANPPPNVWLGTTVEDQQRAGERIPHLLSTPAAVRFLSCEPLLGPVDLRAAVEGKTLEHCIDWVIVGGESGPGARPMWAEWARSIVEQCRAAKVPAFVKQLGARFEDHDADLFGAAALKFQNGHLRKRLTDKKGGDPSEWPAELRVREFPEARRA